MVTGWQVTDRWDYWTRMKLVEVSTEDQAYQVLSSLMRENRCGWCMWKKRQGFCPRCDVASVTITR